jgi:DHA1 family tetracycline resistance protein-like MFS transporter
MRLRIKPLWIIFFTIFIDLLGFGILIPVIPLLLADPDSPYFLLPEGMPLSQGYILLGFLIAIFSMMQFISAPILGQLSDRWGRKKIIAFSLSGTAISYVIFALGIITKNIPLLFASRAFDGLTAGAISAAQASIADITPAEKRVKNFGIIGAAFGLGFVAGPFIGGRLSDPSFVSWFNAATPFWFAAILSFLNVVSILLFFPETLKVANRTRVLQWSKSLMNIVKAYSYKKFRVIFLTVFVYGGGFAFFVTFLNVFLINRFNFDQKNIGDFFAYLGIWGIITQGYIVGITARWFREPFVIKYGIILTGAVMMLFFVPSVWTCLLIITPLFAIVNGLTQTNITALISKTASDKIQGEILGINASVQALSFAFPPVLSGLVAAGTSPETTIFVSSIIVIFSGVLFSLLYKSEKK